MGVALRSPGRPSSPEALSAAAYSDQGNHEEAEEYMELLLEADPHRDESYLLAARIALRAGRPDPVQKILDRWKQFIPRSELLRTNQPTILDDMARLTSESSPAFP